MNASGNLLALFQMSKSCRKWRNQMRETNLSRRAGHIRFVEKGIWRGFTISLNLTRSELIETSHLVPPEQPKNPLPCFSKRMPSRGFKQIFQCGAMLFPCWKVNILSYVIRRRYPNRSVHRGKSHSCFFCLFFGLSDEWSIQQVRVSTHLHFIHISKQ